MATFFENTRIEFWQGVERKKLKRAFEQSRQWRTISGLDRYKISPGRKYDLLAVNSYSRLHWNHAVSSQLTEFFCDGGDGSTHTGEILWVTLCDRQCVRSRNDRLSDDDLAWIKSRLRIGLVGTSYFAVLEPGYYVNWKDGYGPSKSRRCVSWHLHALVWGITAKELRKRLRKIKKAGYYVRLADGLRPTHVQEFQQGHLPIKVGYLLKSPCSSYRVSKADKVDKQGRAMIDEYGEVVPRFRQGKLSLRPGERFTIYRLMEHLRLNDLAVAGGQGSRILASVKRTVEPPLYRRRNDFMMRKVRPRHYR